MDETEDTRRDHGKIGARLMVLCAAVMWSSSGFFAAAPTFNDWDETIRGPLLAFWRAAFASLVLVRMVRRPRWSLKLVPMILVFAVMNVTYLTAIARSNPTNAIWLQNTAPVWVFLIGVFVFGETAVKRDWLLLLFSGFGVGLILYFELRSAATAGVIYGILAGMTYAGVVLSLRQLRDFDPIWLVAVNHLVTALLLAPYVTHAATWPHGVQWFYLAGFGIFQIGLPYILFARGLHKISGHEAAGIVLMEPILVPVWARLAWGQTPPWWTLAGGGLILTGLLIRYARMRVPR